jgi:hypothetical protein
MGGAAGMLDSTGTEEPVSVGVGDILHVRVSMPQVHASCPCYISMLHVHATCLLYATCPCCMHVHAVHSREPSSTYSSF